MLRSASKSEATIIGTRTRLRQFDNHTKINAAGALIYDPWGTLIAPRGIRGGRQPPHDLSRQIPHQRAKILCRYLQNSANALQQTYTHTNTHADILAYLYKY